MDLFPADAKTFAISVTSTASTAKALGTVAQGATIRLVNEGANRCYIAIGGSGVTAQLPDTTDLRVTCTPVLGGEDLVLQLPAGVVYISAVTRASETATLIVSVGGGL